MSAKPAEQVTYKTDQDEEAYALVRSVNADGSLNLIVFAPETSQPFQVNEVPADRVS